MRTLHTETSKRIERWSLEQIFIFIKSHLLIQGKKPYDSKLFCNRTKLKSPVGAIICDEEIDYRWSGFNYSNKDILEKLKVPDSPKRKLILILDSIYVKLNPKKWKEALWKFEDIYKEENSFIKVEDRFENYINFLKQQKL